MLPSAVLVRVDRPRARCTVPGRRLLIHAAPALRGRTVVTVRALPHGSVLAHVAVGPRTQRAYVSRYAARLCDLNP